MGKYIIEFKGITKQFPGTLANDKVDLKIKKGEIHALLGENGSGKSTLMKILYGLYQPDEGEIFLNGENVNIGSPQKSMGLGIGMIHQEFMLVPQLTVLENILISKLDKVKRINYKEEAKKIKDFSNKLGLKINLYSYVHELSVGDQQKVEIIKTLYQGTDILILDEPTAVLTPQETTDMLVILRKLVKDGKTVVFITHKLEEVLSFTDTVTVLRNGKNIGTFDTDAIKKEELAEKMIGRTMNFKLDKKNIVSNTKSVIVKNLQVNSDSGFKAVDDVSFYIKQGEILGIAGVDGNGQLELSEALAGMRKVTKGTYTLNDENLINKNVGYTVEKGVSFIPGERNNYGVINNLSVKDNIILKEFNNSPFSNKFILSESAIRKHSKTLVKDFQIKVPSICVEAKTLSGGNMQKIILARELSRNPKFLICVQPTRGLDIGAIEYVQNSILKSRESGTAVLLISTELDEILAISDRIAVIFEGKIVGIVNNNESIDSRDIGLMMSGGKVKSIVEERAL